MPERSGTKMLDAVQERGGARKRQFIAVLAVALLAQVLGHGGLQEGTVGGGEQGLQDGQAGTYPGAGLQDGKEDHAAALHLVPVRGNGAAQGFGERRSRGRDALAAPVSLPQPAVVAGAEAVEYEGRAGADHGTNAPRDEIAPLHTASQLRHEWFLMLATALLTGVLSGLVNVWDRRREYRVWAEEFHRQSGGPQR